MAERLLTRTEVAQQLGLSPKTLRNWAWRGLGPTVIYVRGAKQPPRYRQADVDAWLAGRAWRGTYHTAPGACPPGLATRAPDAAWTLRLLGDIAMHRDPSACEE